MTEFGEYIKKVRIDKGLTINQLALYSGISSSQLSRIETGKRGVPKPQTIEKIASALKVDYNELMGIAGYLEGTSLATPQIAKKIANITKDERDIAKQLEKVKHDLENSDGLAFNGEPMSDEAKESLLESMELLFRQTQRINKKFTPKKYRDEE